MDTTMRILMETVNESSRAAEELKQIAMKTGIDVLIMHAPPIQNNEIPGDSLPIDTITSVKDGQNGMPQTSVAILNQGRQVTRISEMSGDNWIYLHITSIIGELHLISMYCPLNISIEGCVEELQRLLQLIGDEPVIICIDSNAKSTWWSNSDIGDDRGDILDDFIIANDLCVMNHNDVTGFFCKRHDYTDVVLASAKIREFINWKGLDKLSSSEKRTAVIELTPNYKKHLNLKEEWKSLPIPP